MLAGVAIFAKFYPALKSTVLTWGDFGQITTPEILGVNHWFIIVLFIVASLFMFRWFEKAFKQE